LASFTQISSRAAKASASRHQVSSPEVLNFALQKAWIQAAMTAELPQGDKQSVKHTARRVG